MKDEENEKQLGRRVRKENEKHNRRRLEKKV